MYCTRSAERRPPPFPHVCDQRTLADPYRSRLHRFPPLARSAGTAGAAGRASDRSIHGAADDLCWGSSERKSGPPFRIADRTQGAKSAPPPRQGRAAGPHGYCTRGRGGWFLPCCWNAGAGRNGDSAPLLLVPTPLAPWGDGPMGPSAPTGEARPPRSPPRACVLNHPADGRPPRRHRGGHRAAAGWRPAVVRRDGRSPVRRA